MLYIIKENSSCRIVTGTNFRDGLDKKGYYKQLYNTKYHPPLILNDGDCELGRRQMLLEILNRRINMDTHRLEELHLDARRCKFTNKKIRQDYKKLLEEVDGESMFADVNEDRYTNLLKEEDE